MGSLTNNTYKRLYLDANVFIYVLESVAPYVHPLTSLLAASADQSIELVTSELTLAEVLVKPIRDELEQAQEQCKQMLTSRPGLRVLQVTRETMVSAATLRARNAIKLPDAIHLATAIKSNCDAMVTNDHRLAKAAPFRILLVSDLPQE